MRLQAVMRDELAGKVKDAARRCRCSVSELLVLIIREADVERIYGLDWMQRDPKRRLLRQVISNQPGE